MQGQGQATGEGGKKHFPHEAGGTPSGGAPIAPASQSSPQQRVSCPWCGQVLREGFEPETTEICGPCEREVRAQAGLAAPEDARTGLEVCDLCLVPLDALLSCPKCGVFHGDPCEDCGRRGYHKDDCPQMVAERRVAG